MTDSLSSININPPPPVSQPQPVQPALEPEQNSDDVRRAEATQETDNSNVRPENVTPEQGLGTLIDTRV